MAAETKVLGQASRRSSSPMNFGPSTTEAAGGALTEFLREKALQQNTNGVPC